MSSETKWVLVPLVPTMSMVVAGFERAYDVEEGQDEDTLGSCKGAAEIARETWAAMLAAAPEPPTDDRWELTEAGRAMRGGK